MSNLFIFGLGISVALVVVFTIAVVVVLFWLGKKIRELNESVTNLSNCADADRRDAAESDSNFHRLISGVERLISDAETSANRYTDSRIDKILSKQ